jgi:hypothetical protein
MGFQLLDGDFDPRLDGGNTGIDDQSPGTLRSTSEEVAKNGHGGS